MPNPPLSFVTSLLNLVASAHFDSTTSRELVFIYIFDPHTPLLPILCWSKAVLASRPELLVKTLGNPFMFHQCPLAVIPKTLTFGDLWLLETPLLSIIGIASHVACLLLPMKLIYAFLLV